MFPDSAATVKRILVPFAMETYGFLDPAAAKYLQDCATKLAHGDAYRYSLTIRRFHEQIQVALTRGNTEMVRRHFTNHLPASDHQHVRWLVYGGE